MNQLVRLIFGLLKFGIRSSSKGDQVPAIVLIPTVILIFIISNIGIAGTIDLIVAIVVGILTFVLLKKAIFIVTYMLWPKFQFRLDKRRDAEHKQLMAQKLSSKNSNTAMNLLMY
jgi:hypothetical protein